MITCDGCPRPAVWAIYTNGENEDGWACGRHLHMVLLELVKDGWAKVDRVSP